LTKRIWCLSSPFFAPNSSRRGDNHALPECPTTESATKLKLDIYTINPEHTVRLVSRGDTKLRERARDRSSTTTKRTAHGRWPCSLQYGGAGRSLWRRGGVACK